MGLASLTIGLTPGCPAGIGPEVWAQAIAQLAPTLTSTTRLRFFASKALLLEGARRAGLQAEVDVQGSEVAVVIGGQRVEIAVADADDRCAHSQVRVVDDDALAGQRDALLRACAAAVRGEIQAMVTGPVRKAALVVHGRHYPGQTELVHEFLHDDDGPPLMVFAGAAFLLGLFTVHVPLAAVPGLVQTASLERAVRRLAEAARALLGVSRPRIAVLGVNPHAGEGGLFGDEEERVAQPLLARLQNESGFDVDAVPRPADGFFADVARAAKGRSVGAPVHAVLAMHHDQGLGPYKLLCGGEGINITWGLRVPRTSPDHGTADALAGTGKADPSSTIAAVHTALRLARS